MGIEKIMIIGALGQIGSELTPALRNIYGTDNVIACDLKEPGPDFKESGPFFYSDVLDKENISSIVEKNGVTQIYHLAAYLSAKAEHNPAMAWKLNMEGLFNILDVAIENNINKLFWPSSIAVFGPTTPKVNTPQTCMMEPNTVYGISKKAGEGWCEWYHKKYGLDIRSLRYPGLISYKTLPGGGTTDYAVDIFHGAVANKRYHCYLNGQTKLPMMYMDDAVRGTIELMEADADNIKIKSSYNITSMSFTPAELTAEIQKTIPEFICDYQPDERQRIADSWPQSIDDSKACEEWGWRHQYDLPKMTSEMLKHVGKLQMESF
ncbi:MAG: NAD-dependent epimerase [Flavobacteriales bacterium]|nr:MAG: NAD-dependent epimerase [Flavobacteriales bacterium]